LVCVLGIGFSVIALTAATAGAGLLYQDPDAYLSGAVRGFGDMLVTADMEYAVYYESAPQLGLDFDNLYIYAYQFYILPPSMMPVNLFTMGLLSPESAIDHEWYVHDQDPGSIAPSSVPGKVGPLSIHWEFNNPNVSQNQHSEILYYTSPYNPDVAKAVGSLGTASGYFPCPKVPEPGTGTLVLIAAFSFLFAGGVRRVLGKM
jgi:hypothetical protein